MKFISASMIAKNKSGKRGGKATAFNGITTTLVYYHNRNVPSRIITIRLDEKSMNQSRINIGDRVDVLFSEDKRTWQVKLLNNDEEARYKVSHASNKSASGVIRFTWYEGMPWFGDFNKTKKIKAKIRNDDKDLKVSIGEICFLIKDPLSFEYINE
ncbi:hypothetical protein RHO12_01945 [Orbus sturtevantii]|uniref:hypothetical protein n=1 Tax=Orbus sturtevantii TaxID=3074109 RepID=UPI00370D3719